MSPVAGPEARPASRRRRWSRALAEMHYELRTEGDTPWRTAGAVFLGTVLGVLPIWGAHLVLCAVLARWFGVSRLKTYLAAHINNPVTVPFLLYGGFAIGHRLLSGSWPELTLAEVRELSLGTIGLQLAAGSVVLGVALGTVAASIAFVIRSRAPESSFWKRLVDAASLPYLDCGIFHWEFVRGKLKYDPLYRGLFQSGCLRHQGLLVDLGCGRGLVPAALGAARAMHREGLWDPAWPEPPLGLAVTGVERRAELARVARAAIGDDVQIDLVDLRGYTPPPCDVVLLLDVLHYLDGAAQETVIRRAAQALRPGGVLLLREPDAALGARMLWTRLGERVCALARRHWRQHFRYRSAAAWRRLIEAEGLSVVASPMWAGTPYGNVLLEATRPAGGAPAD